MKDRIERAAKEREEGLASLHREDGSRLYPDAFAGPAPAFVAQPGQIYVLRSTITNGGTCGSANAIVGGVGLSYVLVGKP